MRVCDTCCVCWCVCACLPTCLFAYAIAMHASAVLTLRVCVLSSPLRAQPTSSCMLDCTSHNCRPPPYKARKPYM